MTPKRPTEIHPLAIELLDRMRGRIHPDIMILGGGFALKHYLDHRPTRDVDAWWKEAGSSEAQKHRVASSARCHH